MQGDAFIRAHFGLNPAQLQATEWQERYADAMFIEQTRIENLAKLLTGLAKAMFGKN